MRTRRPLDSLFPRVRQKLLATLLLQPGGRWYGAALARHLGVRRSSLQRELESLTRAGILERRVEGRHVYLRPNDDCPFLHDLRGLLVKTAGIVDVLREILKPHDRKISVAFVYGSIARGEELATSDVDLMVIGELGLAAISPGLFKAEKQLGREVNAVVYSIQEFRDKASANHYFIGDVCDGEKLFVIGGPRELEETLGGEPGRAKGSGKGGDRRPATTRQPAIR